MAQPPDPASPSSPATPAVCPNCGAALAEPRPRFCGNCGQETHVRAPRLGEFLQQFGGAYFATEGALWRTLKLLLLKPGELTRQYLAGRRKHYVLPLRLYLSISLVALLMVRMMGSADVHAPEGADQVFGKHGNMNLSIGGGKAGLRDGTFYCDSLPQWVCTRLQRRIAVDPAALAGEVARMQDRFVGNLGAAMFLLLPSFALWLKLLWWPRRLRYTEHLVFTLHLHALWFLALALAMSGLPWVAGVLGLVVPVHTLLAMKRVYGGRWWLLLLRAGVASLLQLWMLTVAVLMLGVWTLLG